MGAGQNAYLTVPEEIVQYSEGQRIVAAYTLDEVRTKKQRVPETWSCSLKRKVWLMIFKPGQGVTWNARKHRYERYRERELAGRVAGHAGKERFRKRRKPAHNLSFG